MNIKFFRNGILFFVFLNAVCLINNHGLAQSAPKPAPPAAIDNSRIVAADHDPGDWMTTGRTYSEQRFSPLTQINDKNAQKLGLAWFANLEPAVGEEATPLEIDGVLYVSEAWSMVDAFDATTGKQLWHYDPQVPRDWDAKICCGPGNRGVAAWQGKIFVGTIDGRLVALSAANGKVLWSVRTTDPKQSYSITGAPRVIKGRVLIGEGGGEFGTRGYVSAYDANTGKQIWRFYTVPGNPADGPQSAAMKAAAKSWSGEWWKQGGGGSVWDSMAYDPDLDLLYIGTGDGAEWNGKFHAPNGDKNLYTSSIVALRPETGQYVWHFQTTPGGGWDYDSCQHMILADLTIGGRLRKVIMQAPKNGVFFVIDRTNGQFISAKPIVPINWATGFDPKTGRAIVNPNAYYGTTGKTWLGMPGPSGGHNWQPMSFDPQTGLVYIPQQEAGFPYVPDKSFTPHKMGFNVPVDFGAASLPQDPAIKRAAKASLKGALLAWNPVTQQEAWRVQLKGPWNGGILSTAGNLVIEGNAAGNFVVYRADNGQQLWSLPVQTGVIAAPIAYQVGGTEYIAVMAGWGGVFALATGELANVSGKNPNIPRLLVFKLGGTATLPPPPKPEQAVLNPPPQTADAATVAEGKAVYSHFCGACHGDAAVSGGLLPDLRYSEFLKNDNWFNVVLGGALKDGGMASFANSLDRSQVAAIRAYVIFRAHESLAEMKAAK